MSHFNHLHDFNAHFCFCFFANDITCCSLYIYFRLGKWCYTKWCSSSSSKWFIKQQRQLTTSTTPLAQKLLTNVHCSVGSRSYAKDTRALKMRKAVASHQKLIMNNWKDQRSWSSYNTRSCRTNSMWTILGC